MLIEALFQSSSLSSLNLPWRTCTEWFFSLILQCRRLTWSSTNANESVPKMSLRCALVRTWVIPVRHFLSLHCSAAENGPIVIYDWPCNIFALQNLHFLDSFLSALRAFTFWIISTPFSTFFLQYISSYKHHKCHKNLTTKECFKGWKYKHSCFN